MTSLCQYGFIVQEKTLNYKCKYEYLFALLRFALTAVLDVTI